MTFCHTVDSTRIEIVDRSLTVVTKNGNHKTPLPHGYDDRDVDDAYYDVRTGSWIIGLRGDPFKVGKGNGRLTKLGDGSLWVVSGRQGFRFYEEVKSTGLLRFAKDSGLPLKGVTLDTSLNALDHGGRMAMVTYDLWQQVFVRGSAGFRQVLPRRGGFPFSGEYVGRVWAVSRDTFLFRETTGSAWGQLFLIAVLGDSFEFKRVVGVPLHKSQVLPVGDSVVAFVCISGDGGFKRYAMFRFFEDHYYCSDFTMPDIPNFRLDVDNNIKILVKGSLRRLACQRVDVAW